MPSKKASRAVLNLAYFALSAWTHKLSSMAHSQEDVLNWTQFCSFEYVRFPSTLKPNANRRKCERKQKGTRTAQYTAK